MSGVQSLLALLDSIKGQEPDKMNPADRESFRATSLSRFREKSAFLTGLLAEVAGSRIDGYLSEVIPPSNPYCEEWLGTHLLVESQRLERLLDAPEDVQMLAAMVPCIAFKLDLFSEAHHPGYSHAAHLLLRIECHDDPALALVEQALSGAAHLLQPICEATEQFRVVSHEGACVDIVCPKDIACAVVAGVAAVRAEAESNELDPDMRFLEGFGFEVVFNAATSQQVVTDGIRVLLTVFDTVVRELQLMRSEPNPAA